MFPEKKEGFSRRTKEIVEGEAFVPPGALWEKTRGKGGPPPHSGVGGDKRSWRISRQQVTRNSCTRGEKKGFKNSLV